MLFREGINPKVNEQQEFELAYYVLSCTLAITPQGLSLSEV